MAKVYSATNVKNIVVVGHQGVGKTSLVEALLVANKKIASKGKIENCNTVSDYTKEEKDAKLSIYSTVCPVETESNKINFIDTPGFFDFVGEVLAPLEVASGAIVTLRGSKGIEVGTKRALKFLKDRKVPFMIAITRMDRDSANHEKIFDSLSFLNGKAIFMNMPDHDGSSISSIKDLFDENFAEITEKVANCDDELMMKYLEGEEISHDDVKAVLKKAIISGDLIPVLFTSYEKMVGINELLEFIDKYMPSTADYGKIDESKPLSAFVYKSIVDPFQGKMSLVQVRSGKLVGNIDIYNATKQVKDKIGPIYTPFGKDLVPATEVGCGDIALISKVNTIDTNDTICAVDYDITYPKIVLPQPTVYYGIVIPNKNDEPKVAEGLKRAAMEDLTIDVKRNVETKQLVVGCQGNTHIDTILNKIKANYKCIASTEPAKVPYRETIKGTADVEGKHKKQSGGAGQYGDVWIRFSPSDKEFEFVNSVFGGSVPTNYIPAVEKGLIEACKSGVLTGSPVVNIKCDLYDGGYHPVDSNEISFKLAANIAFKAAMEKAKPVLLEPILQITIKVPNEFVGDVMSNISKNRGMVGEFTVEGDMQIVTAELPQIELSNFATDLKTLTQAQAELTHSFLKYAEVPHDQAEKVIAAYKKSQESK